MFMRSRITRAKLMTNQERVQALQRAINLIAEIEVKAKHAEAILEAFRLIKTVGEEILSDVSNAKIEE